MKAECNGIRTPSLSWRRGRSSRLRRVWRGAKHNARGACAPREGKDLGGLLARPSTYSSGSFTNHNCYHADGNGNITYLVNSGQTLAASYRYDPFGNVISSSGTLASANSYQFSSKEFIPGAAAYYYLYRFYDPNLQRWLNRDPIEEEGGINLYWFVFNAPSDAVDPE